jgi:hypothetical protein
MISTTSLSLSLFACMGMVAAQGVYVTIEASHGGAGNGLTNTTITVPIGSIYSGDSALDAVSTLYLVGSTEGTTDGLHCTPYKSTDGTGDSGRPFDVNAPSYLSTNTVVVGSIVCEAADYA